MTKIKILIVDDHALVRAGVFSLLKENDNMEIIGEAENGEEAIEKVIKLKPDVALIDISMPGISGIEATKEIKRQRPETQILILTMHENEEYIYNALINGADGLLHKNTTKEEITLAITKIASGQKFFGNNFSEVLLNKFLNKHNTDGTTEGKIILTKREKEILYWVGRGFSNIEIGDKLNISPRTVDTHKTNLVQKLNLKNTNALIRYAYENENKPG